MTALAMITIDAGAAQAQRGVRVGVLAGGSMSTLTDLAGDLADPSGLETKYRAGFQGGVFAQIPVRGRFSLQPEVHYAQKGAKFEGAFTGTDAGSYGVSLKLAYIDVPVLARFDLGRASGLHPFVVIGPSVSIRTGCTVGLEASGATLDSKCSGDGETPAGESFDPVKKSDISGIAGVGLASTWMGRTVSVQARFTQSLRSIANNDVAGGSPVSPKNRALAVVFGLTR
jgi:hypothetical protein